MITPGERVSMYPLIKHCWTGFCGKIIMMKRETPHARIDAAGINCGLIQVVDKRQAISAPVQ
jgi:hypothetical protein